MYVSMCIYIYISYDLSYSISFSPLMYPFLLLYFFQLSIITPLSQTSINEKDGYIYRGNIGMIKGEMGGRKLGAF